MITKQEFLQIIEKHLILDPNGNIVIQDEDIAKKYREYVQQFAKDPDGSVTAFRGVTINIYCPQK